MKRKTYRKVTLNVASNFPDIRGLGLEGTLSLNMDGDSADFVQKSMKYSRNPQIFLGEVISVRLNDKGVCRGTFQIRAGEYNKTLIKDAIKAVDAIANCGGYYEKYYPEAKKTKRQTSKSKK